MTPEDFKKIASVSYDNVMKKQKKKQEKSNNKNLMKKVLDFKNFICMFVEDDKSSK